MSRLILIALGAFLGACSAASAVGPNVVYVPAVVRNGAVANPTSTPTPIRTQTPTPTPTLAATRTPTPSPAPTGLAVLSKTTYSASLSGYEYVIAKVHNYGPTTYYDPRVTVTFFNASGQVVGSDYGYTQRSMLRSGEFSHLRLITQPQAGWTSYATSSSGRSSTFLTYRHDGLDISGLNSYRSDSTVYVVGLIRNNTGKTLRLTKVDVGIYAGDGSIVDADYTYPWSSNDAAPGASTSFSVGFLYGDRIPSGYMSTASAEGYE